MTISQEEKISPPPQADSNPHLNRGPIIGQLVRGGFVIVILGSIATFFASTVNPSSNDAVVNGRLTDIRAIEDGTVDVVKVEVGESVEEGAQLLKLSNDRLYALQLQKTQIEGRIKQLESEQQQLEISLGIKQTLLSKVVPDAQSQRRLEMQEQQEQVSNLQAELEGAREQRKLAELTLDRAHSLYEDGVYAKAVFDLAEVELAVQESRVKSLEAQIGALETNADAASESLSLSRTPSNYDPRIRQQELEAQISEQSQAQQSIKTQQQALKKELKTVEAEILKKGNVTLFAPANGVIWNLTTEKGTWVKAGESLGQIVNCDQLWVDMWIEENKLSSLKPESEATISIEGLGKKIEGSFTLVRYGMERPIVGSDVSGFLDPTQPRRAQVRVEIDPSSAVLTKLKNMPSGACGIGLSAKVTFSTWSDAVQTIPAWFSKLLP